VGGAAAAKAEGSAGLEIEVDAMRSVELGTVNYDLRRRAE
jgi:hypothetical protein